VESLKKTNRVLFLDEDFEGGASAYMMQQVLEVQGGYRWLDSNRLHCAPNHTVRPTDRMAIISPSHRWRMLWKR